jgi:DNA-binding transcriptional regulator YdaS (Cro superfamily)
MKNPIDEAIKAAGSQQALGKLLGISQAAVSEWRLRGRIPAERVLRVEAVTGVSRYRLRPDIYPSNKETP